MRRVINAWKVIEGVLFEHAHSVYRSLRPPATDEQVAHLEAALGRKLPPDLAASLRIHDGTDAVETQGLIFVDVYALLSSRNIASRYEMSRQVSGQTDRSDDKLSPSGMVRTDVRWRRGWIPVLVEASGGFILIDLEPGPAGSRGQVVKFDNWGGPNDLPIAPSWRAWLDTLATRLERRAFVLDEFGGINAAPGQVRLELEEIRKRAGVDDPAEEG